MTDKNEPAQPEGHQPIINIAGEKVALGPIRRDLVPLYQRWSNDFEVMRYYGGMRPLSREEAEQWYQSTNKNERAAYFTIYDLVSLLPVGYTGLVDISQFHRTPNLTSLLVIGRVGARAMAPRSPGWCWSTVSPVWACTTSFSACTPRTNEGSEPISGPAFEWLAVYGKPGGGPAGPTIFY